MKKRIPVPVRAQITHETFEEEFMSKWFRMLLRQSLMEELAKGGFIEYDTYLDKDGMVCSTAELIVLKEMEEDV